MAKQTINVGTIPNDRTGDPLRNAFTKINSNFTELYNTIENPELPYIELQDQYTISGNTVTFTKPANTSVSDVIDTGLSLTRSIGAGGLYNDAIEGSFNRNVSPANTEWNWSGWDNLENIKSRQYRTFTETLKRKVGSFIVGAELVMHDLTNDKYYKIMFTSWNQGQGNNSDGSFSYTRELIDTTKKVGLTFPDGTVQSTAVNPLDFSIVYLNNENYTLKLVDANRTIQSFDNIIFVPRDSDVNFPVGTKIEIISLASNVIIERVQHIQEVEASIYGVGFGEARSSWLLPQHSVATLIKVNTNMWYLNGKNIEINE